MQSGNIRGLKGKPQIISLRRISEALREHELKASLPDNEDSANPNGSDASEDAIAEFDLRNSGTTCVGSALAQGRLVPRPALLHRTEAALKQHHKIVIYGAIRSGKSCLVRMLLSEIAMQDVYKNRMMLDCFALRAKSLPSLHSEALWMLRIKNNEHRQDFAASLSRGSRLAHADQVNPLVRYFKSGAVDNSLLVLDHAERVTGGPEGIRWLDEVLKEAGDRGIHVIIIYAATDMSSIPHIKALRDLYHVNVPDLSIEEIEQWLDIPTFDRHRQAGLTATNVHSVTGGRPGLVGDLQRFLNDNCDKGWLGQQALALFEQRQAEMYSMECDCLIRVLRCRPNTLVTKLDLAPKHIQHEMLATGALKNEGGRLRFVSPIISRRYDVLTWPDNLIWLLAKSEIGLLAKRARHSEIVGVPLADALLCEDRPRVALARYAEFLIQRGISNVEIYIRDRDNSKLWSLIYDQNSPERVASEAWPLEPSEKPDFARAVFSGRRVIGKDCKVYFPSVGHKGRVELLAMGRAADDFQTYDGRIQLRALWNIVMALEQALGTIVEKLALRRQLRVSEHSLYRLREADASLNAPLVNVMREARCSAVAVLERDKTNWVVTRCAGTGLKVQHASAIPWSEMLIAGDQEKLDDIASHPSRRGLVLTGRDLVNAFPRFLMFAPAVAVSLQPVWLRGGAICRLVAFAFEGNASRDINGARQKQLTFMATYAVAT